MLTKVYLVKAMVLPVVMYRCESWTIKGCTPRNWCFWIVVLEKTLEGPLDCKEIQPVHPKGDSPGCSLEGLLLKLKLQFFDHLLRKADSFEKTLTLGKIEGRGEGNGRRWDGWMASLTQWIWVWAISGSWWWIERPGVLQSMGSQRIGHDWATELRWTSQYCKVINLQLK